jgi:hypothetical protein
MTAPDAPAYEFPFTAYYGVDGSITNYFRPLRPQGAPFFRLAGQVSLAVLGAAGSVYGCEPLVAVQRTTSQGVGEALKYCPGPWPAKGLVDLLQSSNQEVRSHAVMAVSESERPVPWTVLAWAVKEPNSYLRKCAFQALGFSRDRAAIPTVRAGLTDAERQVREAAIDALCQLKDVDGLLPLLPEGPRNRAFPRILETLSASGDKRILAPLGKLYFEYTDLRPAISRVFKEIAGKPIPAKATAKKLERMIQDADK